MKKAKNIICLILVIVLVIVIIFAIVNKTKKTETTTEENISETKILKMDILNTLASNGYIQTALEEEKELHATYYLEETYFETNQIISSGKKLLKYTNDTYLKAPYDCIVTEYSLPDEGDICTDKHYIKIQSIDSLKITLAVEEDELETVYIGQEAQVEIDTLENKKITGYITNIGNIANYSSSGSEFEITVEFENDGEILIGMSAKCSIILEKSLDTLAVASEAITEENGKKYLKVKNEKGEINSIEIETGIANDAYTEVKSGVSEGDIIIIEKEEEQNSQNRTFQRGGNSENRQNFNREQMERPEIPSGESRPQIPNN